MPELFVELFSEEIPARLQARGAAELARLVGEALAPLAPSDVRTMWGPRRIALAADVRPEVDATTTSERGPRLAAPEQALAGFLRKHGASRESLREEGGFWVLERRSPAVDAASLVAGVMPGLLRRFAWPKSMRWGSSDFQWIRPLRRIVCLLDGAVVPWALAAEGDDGHGLAAGDLTEGHRVHAPGPVRVTGFSQWQAALRAHRVVADSGERARLVRDGIAALASARGLSVVDDPGLVDDVAGLVEWPVPLLGRIDDAFMDLPPEVMQVSMRVNQRYFALRDAEGRAAPWFGFAANVEAPDGGLAIVTGNERVLRARFSDARHFWDADRRTRLADRVPALDGVTFQSDLGSQGDRSRRLEKLASALAAFVNANVELATRAARLCKADLVTGMVGEFPELQGTMGGYYARHDQEDELVARAIAGHYKPQKADDIVPVASTTVAVSLADKLDQLAGFFAIGKKPTGSSDPFALRRAALGIHRILMQSHHLRVPLRHVLRMAAENHRPTLKSVSFEPSAVADEVLSFIIERVCVQQRADGARHDVLAAVFSASSDDDLARNLARSQAIDELLGTEDGVNLLAAYKRADNILRIEERRDGPHGGPVDGELLQIAEERALHSALSQTWNAEEFLAAEKFREAMVVLASLRSPLDNFFEKVTVNAEQPDVRTNRLRLLSSLRRTLNQVADFSLIEA